MLALALMLGQVATICGVTAPTVIKWVDSGLLAGYRSPPTSADVRRARRITGDSLRAFFALHELPFVVPAPPIGPA